MPGYIKDEDSLATGIPDRNIGPETGSWGNATVTNKADTGQGTNQDHESVPPPAAGLDGPRITTDDRGEHHRSFAPEGGNAARTDLPENDIEPVYQQIADGGDHFDHHKHRHEAGESEAEAEERRRRERMDKAP